MSLRSNKNSKYNRALDREERDVYWMELLLEETTHWYEEEENHSWGYHCGIRECCGMQSMEEYHQMRLIKTLSKLDIRAAVNQADDQNW